MMEALTSSGMGIANDINSQFFWRRRSEHLHAGLLESIRAYSPGSESDQHDQ